MKTLIVFYSRTENTKKIAKTLQKSLNCDIEEIKEKSSHNGPIGYMKGGFESSTGRASPIKPISKDPSQYDLVIIGTPVWAANMASPMISYLKDNGSKINELACFCTCGGSGYDKTLKKIETAVGKTSKTNFYLTSNDINSPDEKINQFIKELQ